MNTIEKSPVVAAVAVAPKPAAKRTATAKAPAAVAAKAPVTATAPSKPAAPTPTKLGAKRATLKAPAKAVAKTVAKTVAKAAAKVKVAKAVKATKVVKAPKPKKPKMVRDSMTMPKAEYAVIDELKLRAAKLGRPVKKTELLRAGIKALAAMADTGFLVALKAVPSLKTGRPSKS